MNYIYGSLDESIVQVTDNGSQTDTILVTVHQDASTISAEIIKVPPELLSPKVPMTEGNYVLQANVSKNGASYSWVKVDEVLQHIDELQIQADGLREDLESVKAMLNNYIANNDKAIQDVRNDLRSESERTDSMIDQLNQNLVDAINTINGDIAAEIRERKNADNNIVAALNHKVGSFTNDKKGIIQGSINDGYVAAEDGLGKVSGWETVKTDITNLQNDKVDKVEGKQLSTEDFTTAEKEKLAGIEENANNYVLPDEVVKSVAGMTGPTVTLGTLTFTGAATGSYDGRANLTLDIPTIAGPIGPTGPTGPTGPQGAKGENGTGVNIEGTAYYNGDIASQVGHDVTLYTTSSYETKLEANAAGEGYIVSGYLCVATESLNIFTVGGEIKGPQGDTGPTGPTGADGATGLLYSGSVSATPVVGSTLTVLPESFNRTPVVDEEGLGLFTTYDEKSYFCGYSVQDTSARIILNVNTVVDLSNSGDVTELTAQQIRVYDLEEGVYKWTNTAARTILYNGASGTETTSGGAYGTAYLYVYNLNTDGTSKAWWMFYGSMGAMVYVKFGTVSSTSGLFYVKSLMDIPNLNQLLPAPTEETAGYIAKINSAGTAWEAAQLSTPSINLKIENGLIGYYSTTSDPVVSSTAIPVAYTAFPGMDSNEEIGGLAVAAGAPGLLIWTNTSTNDVFLCTFTVGSGPASMVGVVITNVIKVQDQGGLFFDGIFTSTPTTIGSFSLTTAYFSRTPVQGDKFIGVGSTNVQPITSYIVGGTISGMTSAMATVTFDFVQELGGADVPNASTTEAGIVQLAAGSGQSESLVMHQKAVTDYVTDYVATQIDSAITTAITTALNADY